MTKKQKKITFILGSFLTVVTIVGIVIGWWSKEEKTIEGNNNRVNSDNNTFNYHNETYYNENQHPQESFSNKSQKKEGLIENNNPQTRNTEISVKRLAILPFENSSKNEEFSWLSKGISESLVESFSDNLTYRLIEANQRDKILNEINFQQGNYVDVETAVKIGKLLGASQVLIGSYQINNKKIYLSSRIIDVQEGTINKKSITTLTDSLTDVFNVQKKFGTLVKINNAND